MIIAVLVHIAVSTLIALALATAYGQLTPLIAGIALFMGIVAGLNARPSNPSDKLLAWTAGVDGWIERALILFLTYVCVRQFAYLFYPVGSEWRTLNPNNYGDLPLHINYIKAMSLGNPFPLVNPSFSQETLRYPLGIDLYDALWDVLGVPLSSHLFLVGMLGSLASLFALRAYASWWGLVGFFLSGAWTSTQQVDWKNLFLAVFVTQRGFLFAIPVGLVLLMQASKPRLSAWWFGILWGSLALFHLHSFLAISLMLLAIVFLERKFKYLLRAAVLAVPLASVFVLYSTGFLTRAGFVRWQIGWMHTPQTSLFAFLNTNFGPYLFLLVIFAGYLLWRARKDFEARHTLILLSVFFLIFTLFFNLMFAPWPWDNIKLLVWPYLGFLALVAVRARMPWYISIPVVITLGFSGFGAIAPSLISTASAQMIYRVGDLANAEGATRDLPRSARFISGTSHLHPLTFLGRNRVIGYPGHLWSHGIESSAQTLMHQRIMKDDPNWKTLAHELKATHIYWGPDERQEFGSQPRSWQSVLRNVSPVEGIEIYEIQ